MRLAARRLQQRDDVIEVLRCKVAERPVAEDDATEIGSIARRPGAAHQQARAFAPSVLLQGCAISISAICLILSLRLFLSKPAIGSAVAMMLFALAAGLAYV